MKTIFENVIRSGSYKLADLQRKINETWAGNGLSDADKDTLLRMAAEGVTVSGEKPSDDARFAALLDRIEKLEAEVFKASDGSTIEAWQPWDGISNKYQPGAVVSHKGKVWKNIHTAQNVWEPGAAGTERLWEETPAA